MRMSEKSRHFSPLCCRPLLKTAFKKWPRTGFLNTNSAGFYLLNFRIPLQKILRDDYAFIAIGKVGAASKQVTQEFHLLDRATKNKILQDALQDCMKEDRKGKILIFCNTKRMADFLGIWIQEWLPKVGKFLTTFHFCLFVSTNFNCV